MAASSKNSKTRVRKAPQYKSFKLSKKIKNPGKPLPGIYRLYKQSLSLLFQNKKLFFGITGIYIFLTLIFVSGFGLSVDFNEAKQSFSEAFGENSGRLTTSLALFSFLVSSGNTVESESGGVYRLFLSIVVSLVIIWAIRQIYAGEKPSVKQSFYQGVYPLVPFILVLVVVSIQLIPFLIGSFLSSVVFSTGIAVTAAEKILWILIFGLLTLLSLYMIISSAFALYIVTLPDMTPMRALRSARGLVLHRRLSIGLRIIGLPITTLLLYVLILLPIIFVLPALAVPVFICLTGLVLFIVHAYMYNLYRALL
ncbi:hypothetical protein HZB74_03325 [Candidatus Saccharibacteria bacterium]|nr:hypothetical protein [Candidatus Saccharibacteria bacterium]